MSDRTVKPSELKLILQQCMKVKRPVFIWAGPGVGKSDIVAQIGKETDRPVIDMRLLLMDPTDIKGIPYFNSVENTMKWAPSSELPKEGDVSMENAILFLDEMNSAPASVQGAAYQLILNRRIGEYNLPAGVDIIAAGNRDTDRGVTSRMPTPLANRFVHVELTVVHEEWQKWAINNNIHPDVIGYLAHAKQDLCKFDPKSQDKAFATPRSWQFVSDLITDDLPDSINAHLVAGAVGEGIGIQFMQHRLISSKMPRPEDVLSGKVTKLEIKEISAKYSLAISLCYTLQESHKQADSKSKTFSMEDWHNYVNHFFRFIMDNFEPEMIILASKTALRDYALPIDNKKCKHFKEFYSKYGKFVLDSQ